MPDMPPIPGIPGMPDIPGIPPIPPDIPNIENGFACRLVLRPIFRADRRFRPQRVDKSAGSAPDIAPFGKDAVKPSSLASSTGGTTGSDSSGISILSESISPLIISF